VLFVTHNLREGIALADRILFLSHSPGKVIHELKVDLPRPRKMSDPGIDGVYRSLMTDHPEILSGMLSTDQGESQQPVEDREAV
jgi:NitT/TauT family transport system ATP-binding protein